MKSGFTLKCNVCGKEQIITEKYDSQEKGVEIYIFPTIEELLRIECKNCQEYLFCE